MELTVEEKKFRNLMVVYFFLFLAGGLSFYIRPEKITHDLITLGTWLGFAEFEVAEDRFWVILSVAMMATISTCCLMASIKVRETRNYVIPVIISKMTSSGLGMAEFVTQSPHPFHYLVISLVDFPLFIIAVIYYIRAIRSTGKIGRPVANLEKTEIGDPPEI